MLMRNIDKEKGLCNGTRLIVKALVGKYLHVYNPATKEDVCLPRFELISDIKMWIIMETSSISYTTCFCNDNKQKSRSNIYQ